ncbi:MULTISPECIES: hypothetical protein [unclassified Streptomyces]|uniref:hypothetical protein n=1 Tax=unclassified Streptomyces TaxID=2593676 RepID=UPI00137054C1|nr:MULTISPECIES: hypothetical protein [unclassified Streptomyces]MYT73545.1 hypothetical protein [Streptomyces sp. SID8367]
MLLALILVLLLLMRPLNWGTVLLGLLFALFCAGVQLKRPRLTIAGGIGIALFLLLGL